MTEPTLVGIAIAPAARAPLRSVPEVRALPGRGLEGDRYALGAGTFSSWPGDGRHVTLIDASALRALREEAGIAMSFEDTRRNLLTQGVDLPALIGQRFRVGEVTLLGRRPADPCAHLEDLTQPGVLRGLVARGGLRADVETEGTLRVGDPLVVLGPIDAPE